jgi:hypothetical protein
LGIADGVSLSQRWGEAEDHDGVEIALPTPSVDAPTLAKNGFASAVSGTTLYPVARAVGALHCTALHYSALSVGRCCGGGSTHTCPGSLRSLFTVNRASVH